MPDATLAGDAVLTLELPRDLSAPGLARRHVRDLFAARLDPEQLGDLVLATTELVTNAVVHGEGSIRLELRDDGDHVRGEVIDEGTGFEHEIRERGVRDLDGRGLLLVAELAQRWGVHEGTTHVWFELDLRGEQPGVARPRLGAAQRPSELA